MSRSQAPLEAAAGGAVAGRFGVLLRQYRLQTRDSERQGRRLSQERLGELLGRALGHGGYSGAAVSEWERGKSKINEDDRHVLVSLVQVLHERHVLEAPAQADELLLAGNYRPLDDAELKRAFPDIAPERLFLADRPLLAQSALGKLAPLPDAEARRAAGPPHWTARLLAGMGKALEGWSGERVLRALPWVGLWLLTWKGALALCRWPFAGPDQLWAAVVVYAGSALVAPPLLALATRPGGEAAGLLQEKAARLYVHLGAMIGYHVGYMTAFALALGLHYLEIGPLPAWATGLLAIWPLALGHTAARRVPVDQYRAYGRLRPALPEYAILVGFGLFGLWWGGFFFVAYQWLLQPVLGFALILLALVGAAAWAVRQSRR